MTPVEEIKSRLRVEEVIGDYIPLTKAGFTMKALCPFHQEKTPSFSVSPEKQIWHCFGCGEGGDLISFVQRYEGVEFQEALQILATKAGITLSRVPVQNTGQKKKLFEMHEVAARTYVAALTAETSDAKKVREYISKRGVTDETRELFQLGFAPDGWDVLARVFKEKKFTEKEIIAAGLGIGREGKFYDRFRRRLMFPIRDIQGRTVAFTARTLAGIVHADDEVAGKYINSPQTSIYNKSAVLYGFDLAKHDIRRLDYAIIVEGNMDVVMSYQSGIKNVVAASGTALTIDQLRLLERYTKNIILAFDADTAGSRAVFKGITLAWERDMNVKVISLKDGKDPADVVRDDPDMWRTAIKDAIGVVDFYFEQILARVDLSRADHKKMAVQRIGGIIGQLRTAVEQEHYIALLAEKLELPERAIRESISTNPIEQKSRTAPEQIQQKESQKVGVDGHFMSLIAQYPQFIDESKKELEPEMLSEQLQDLYKQMLLHYTSNRPADFSSIIQHLEGHHATLWSTIVFRGEELYSELTPREQQHEFEQLVRRIKEQHYRQKEAILSDEIRVAEADGDTARIQQLEEEKQQLIQERNRLTARN